MTSIDLAGAHVFLAMPTHRDIHPYTAVSLLETQRAFHERGLPLDTAIIYGSSLPHHARTKVAYEFLRSKASLLFWVDSDMQWSAADFLRVAALTQQLDIVAGAYTAKADPPLFMVKADLSNIQGNEQGCLAMDGLGLGFCCMKREVVEAAAAHAPKKKFNGIDELIPHIFRYDETAEAAGGEDMAFFADVKALGYQLWVDPTVVLGHIGSKTYRAAISDYLEMKET